MRNYGYYNERDYEKEFNDKRIKDLGPFYRYVIESSFQTFDEEDMLKSAKYGIHVKPDIYIDNGKEVHYYSIKSGLSEFLQEEHINTLINFLYKEGMSVRTCKAILLFHHSDGTIDGSGTRRMDFNEAMSRFKTEIEYANNEMAQREIIDKVTQRYIFTGGHTETHQAEFVIYGYRDFGIMANEKEIRDYTKKKLNTRLKKPHAGPITFRPKYRDIGKEKKPDERAIVSIEWENMLHDLMEISHIRDMKSRNEENRNRLI